MTGIQPDEQDTREAAGKGGFDFDWRTINPKWLALGAAVIAVGAVAFWFTMSQRDRQRELADQSLTAAKQSIATGNVPLAQTDLQRLVTRWGNTRAGVEAAMVLAQLHYEQGKHQAGIDVLKSVADHADKVGSGVAVRGMIADGQAQLGKLKEAVAGYRDAAEAAQYPGERTYQLTKAARVASEIGDTATARQIWEQLVADPETNEGTVAEARVRLGELEVRPAGRS